MFWPVINSYEHRKLEQANKRHSLPNGSILVTVGESSRNNNTKKQNKRGRKEGESIWRRQWVDRSNVPQWKAMNLGKTDSVTR